MRKSQLSLAGVIAVAVLGLLGSVGLAGETEEQVILPTIVPESYVLPEYPEDARKAGIEGTVLIEVLVTRHGQVGAVTIREGIEGYPSMGRSAVAALCRWTFEPATRDGEPVDLEITIPVKFVLDGKKGCE